MHLTVLGCSGSVPGPDSPASGYLIEADGCRLVLDLGNGTLSALQARCDPFAVDAVLLSHLHPDHCADFSGLAVLRRYHPVVPYDPRTQRLAVYAPAEAPSRLAAAYAPNAAELATTDLSDVFDFHALGEQPFQVGPFEVLAVPVAHPCEAFGFRISCRGRTLAYTGDSGPCPALFRLADSVDVLLAEASWPHGGDYPADLHLSGHEAGEIAAAAGVRRLLITHVPPWTDQDAMLAEARAVFTGDAELAKAGATYEVGTPT